jgi:NTE family protein
VDTLGDWLSHRPFTLGLSSGFFGFFAHTGVLQALHDAGLHPIAAAGSSAGALVAGAHAAGLTPDALADRLQRLRTEEFWDPAPALGIRELGFIRVGRFTSVMGDLLGAPTFASLRLPLAISTFDVRARQTHVIVSGPLVPAIVASCSVPFLFQPVRHDGRLLSDGGVRDRAGLAGVSSGTRVLHHHLASRSPWRRSGDPQLSPPSRSGLVSLVLEGLPRSGPHRLDAGVVAMGQARERVKRALDARVPFGLDGDGVFGG